MSISDVSVGEANSGTVNAALTVSGFADPIARETNSVNDLIPGVTLDLAATGGPVTVAVTTDGNGVTADIELRDGKLIE